MTTRRSPIPFHLLSAVPGVGAVVAHPTEFVKIGLKGPGLDAWIASHDLPLPVIMHEVRQLEQEDMVARVDRNEVILESLPGSPLRAQIEKALESPHPNVYRLEQQSATFVLSGELALAILAQACGYDFSQAESLHIIYTRIAGVSCGVIPMKQADDTSYRVWVDYSYGRYFYEQMVQILLSVLR